MKHSVLSVQRLKTFVIAGLTLAITTQVVAIDHEPLVRSDQVDTQTVMQHALTSAPEKNSDDFSC